MEKSGAIRRLTMLAVCLAAAFALLLLCSQSSPLYPTNIWPDANCLLTVGRAMKEGAVLYRDIYEQKGPTLYLIHLFAAWISDSSFFGVFILEVLSLAAVLVMACRLFERRCAGFSAPALAALAASLVLCGGAFMMGDSAEEFCLPYLMGALCMAMDEYGGREGPMRPGRLFACGLLAGVVATIKFTVLGLFVGLCIAEGVAALRAGGLRRAAQSAAAFLLGMLLPVGLWCLYFAVHGALSDCYTAYVHNNIFLYQGEARAFGDVLREIARAVRDNLPAAAVGVVGLLALMTDSGEPLRLRLTVLCMAVGAGCAVFLPGRVFAYYPLALGVFVFAGMYGLLSAAARMRAMGARCRRMLAPCACALALLAALLLSPNRPLRGVPRAELAQTRLAAYVHPGATLLQYSHLDDGLYLAAGTLPQDKYFVRLNVGYDEMLSELDRYLEEGRPDYVLVSWEELPDRFDRYQWIATDAGYDDQNRINKLLHLYRRK